MNNDRKGNFQYNRPLAIQHTYASEFSISQSIFWNTFFDIVWICTIIPLYVFHVFKSFTTVINLQFRKQEKVLWSYLSLVNMKVVALTQSYVSPRNWCLKKNYEKLVSWFFFFKKLITILYRCLLFITLLY